MNDKILIICPTRSRNANHTRLANSFLATKPVHSKLLFGLDDDDEQNYTRIRQPEILYHVDKRLRQVGTTNLIASIHAENYGLIGVMGDDSVFKSQDWEKQVLDAHAKGSLIISPADRRSDALLPAAFFVDTRIVRQLGFVYPPNLQHLCGDDFLLALGKALGHFEFLPDCLIEHLHYLVGKAAFDDVYQQANNGQQLDRDCMEFDRYMEHSFLNAVDECRKETRLDKSTTFSLQLKRGTRTIVSTEGADLSANRPVKVMICTPFYHPTCSFSFLRSMWEETPKLSKYNIQIAWQPTIGDVVHRQRNILTAVFLASDFDVLLFVDTDTGFKGEDVARMVLSDMPVVVTNYPKRNYYFDAGVNGDFTKAEDLRDAMLRGTVEPRHNARVVNGMTEVNYGGTGLMAIQRRVFTSMIEKGLAHPLNGRPIPAFKQFHFRFFEFVVSNDDHDYGANEDLGEDYTFCDKVRAAGYDVFCDFEAQVSHDGLHSFEGKARLKAPITREVKQTEAAMSQKRK